MKDFLSQAGKLLKEHKQYKRQLTVFLCLAVIVAFSTVTALKLYGQAMTHKMEVLDCQYQVHQHIEDCYAKDEQGNPGTELICGYADYAIHAHNEDCYDSKGNLVCGLEEHEKHEHTDECFTTELVLVCGLEEVIPEETPEDEAGETPEEPAGGEESTPEAAGQPEAEAPVVPEEESEPIQEEVLICQSEVHAHSEGCYETALACGQEEHVHGEGCTSQELACGTEEHAHGEGCYDEEGNLTCEVQEHAHEEACYTTANVCGAEEHTHGDECYTTNLICGIEEHEHTESCYELVTVPAPADNGTTEPTVETPAAGEDSGAGAEPTEPAESTEPAEPESEAPAESEPEGHVHTEACYEEVKTLVCEEQELHIHDNSCYGPECFDENGALIEGSRVSCGLLQLEEHTHAHTEGEDSCFKTVELTPEEVEALENGAMLHIHEESCYDEEGNLICGHDATHIHVPECYDEAGELICGYGTASHVHEDKCYDENGELTCGYETASHVHEDSCYDAEGKLQCGYEAASHVHEDSCYDEEGELVCGYETAAHVHEDSCYDEEGKLQCGYETASHVHEDSCYDEDGKLVCGYETASHVHEENCYDEEGNLICGYETASHVHQESCYDEEGNLVCGYEAASHPHTEDCYDEEGNLICGYETATHVHNESCYDEEGNVICGYAAEIHEHDEDCYDEEGNLICGYNKNGSALDALYCNELVHQHDEDCYDEAGNLTCGKADFAAHTHTDECYNVEGKKICPLPEIEAHVHSEACYPEGAAEGESEAEPSCGKEEIALHTHTEECYDADGVLTCGVTEVLEHVHSEDCKVSGQSVTKTFENESFIITAVYNRDANIPEEAELLAEQITEESNGEHYAKRQAEYQEALGDDMATMRALLKIGFYVNGQEVEPESPVTVTIQFLNEDGLAEGKPITVIHFAEDGTELLEGSTVEDNSTTFEIESFSEIAVGYGIENVRVPVNAELKYKTDELDITFRIEGEVNVPVEGMRPRKDAGAEGEATVPGESDEAEAEESGAEEDAVADEAEEDSFGLDESRPEQDNADVFTKAKEAVSDNGVSVVIENNELKKDLEFKVEALDENSDEYAAMAVPVYGEELTDMEEQLLLQVLSYGVFYDGEELDLSDCVITADIMPTEELTEYAESALDTMTLELEDEVPLEDVAQPEVMITAGTEGGEIEAFTVRRDAKMTILLDNLENRVKVSIILSRANPNFTVQYYADIKRMVKEGQPGLSELSIFDTSGKVLPTNESAKVDPNNSKNPPKPDTQNFKPFFINSEEGSPAYGSVAYTSELTEMYKSRKYEYVKAPSINYFDALVDNSHYVLEEVWVIYDPEGRSLVCGEENHIHEDSCYYYPHGEYTSEEYKAYIDGLIKQEETKAESSILRKEAYDTSLHFTNREVTAEGSNRYILIKDNSVVRLIYRVSEEANKEFAANFYDYNISDGKIYEESGNQYKVLEDQSRTVLPTNEKPWYMNTNQQGINFEKNYTGSTDSKLAFGNGESTAPTGLGDAKWNEYFINQANLNVFRRCSFGLVSGLTKEGKLIYSDGINAPKLFNEGPAIGKVEYAPMDYPLLFKREGDTYTLTAVKNTATQNLDKFSFAIPAWGSTFVMWSNNFWPMDAVPSAGTPSNDPKFGLGSDASSSTKSKRMFFNEATKGQTIAPTADNKQEHNAYFGMMYQVEFDLGDDYVGPLEYYFFGDDDMWVFLDQTLVCDIGGVHQSVGEFVNLWDYKEELATSIEHEHDEKCSYKDVKTLICGNETHEHSAACYQKTREYTCNKHRLTFFYTERGASGSTCWMQFTLPSVTSLTPEQSSGQITNSLKVGKEVIGTNAPTDLQYEFSIHFTKDNVDLPDDYSYTKYDKDGNVVDYDVIIWDGGTFRLGNGEYVMINYLPVGTTYEIKETGKAYKFDEGLNDWVEVPKQSNPNYEVIIDGEKSDDGVKKDEISETETTVNYINDYGYALPETGGTGTILYTMAGGMVVIFGAGFLYKKKFRERRG